MSRSSAKRLPARALLLTLLTSLLLASPAVLAQSLDQAARQAARQYDAKVLSAHTEQRGDRKVHVIKLLTKDGVVKTVTVTVRDKKGG